MNRIPLFYKQVYKLTKKIPQGKVTTYKAIALALNSKAYRAVGQALRHNPFAPEVPCHRVIASNGTIGGFDGQTTGKKIKDKKKMLQEEGISFEKNKVKNFKQDFFDLKK